MKRSDRIEPLRTLAGGEEKDRSLDYGSCKQQYDHATQQLEELRTYLQEYHSNPSHVEGSRLDIARMQQDRQFLLQLAETIRIQEETVARCAQAMEAAREQWMDSRTHSKRLERLHEGYRKVEQSDADRREQSAQDDLSGQRHTWNKNNT